MLKRFLFCIVMFLFVFTARATTETLQWYVDGNVYTTTQCESGGDVILPTAPTKTGYNFDGWFAYTPVEYLEFTGDGQRLYSILPITSFYSHVKIGVSLTRSSFMDICGSNGYAFGNNGSFFIYTDSGFTSSTTTTQTGKKYDIEYIVTAQDIELNVDGTKVTRNTNTQISNDITINIGASVNKRFYGKIYYYQIFAENGDLLADLIPVLDYNRIPCMFDKVEGKFYYNQGTGDFIAGPVVG